MTKRIRVDVELLKRAKSVADDAAVFGNEVLSRHERELGRTTAKNKIWAEILEQSISDAERIVDELKKVIGA